MASGLGSGGRFEGNRDEREGGEMRGWPASSVTWLVRALRAVSRLCRLCPTVYVVSRGLRGAFSPFKGGVSTFCWQSRCGWPCFNGLCGVSASRLCRRCLTVYVVSRGLCGAFSPFEGGISTVCWQCRCWWPFVDGLCGVERIRSHHQDGGGLETTSSWGGLRLGSGAGKRRCDDVLGWFCVYNRKGV